MSPQLAFSSLFSVLAMAALCLTIVNGVAPVADANQLLAMQAELLPDLLP